MNQRERAARRAERQKIRKLRSKGMTPARITARMGTDKKRVKKIIRKAKA